MSDENVTEKLPNGDEEENGDLILEGVELEDAVAQEGGAEAGSNDDDEDDSADDNADLQQVEPEDAEEATGNNELPNGNLDWATLSKSDAKKRLSKQEYKMWKKLHKSKKSKKDDSSRREKKRDKDRDGKSKKKRDGHHKKSKEEDAAEVGEVKRKKGRSGKGTSSHQENGATGDEGKPRKRQRREVPDEAGRILLQEQDGAGVLEQVANSRPSAATQRMLRDQKNRADAIRTLELMQQARHNDELARREGRPPLHRVAIKDLVIQSCRRIALHEYLVHGAEGGILNELAYWLYDRSRKELGPIDLRTAALELLMFFEISGVTHMHETQQKPTKKAVNEDEVKYEGITREELQQSSIGKAVNFVRRSTQETPRNRNIACKLLQRFSRAFSQELDNEEHDAEPIWGCMGDPTVLTPFSTVKTASELFHQRITKVDELDPTSYARVPPRRIEKSVITNLKPK